MNGSGFCLPRCGGERRGEGVSPGDLHGEPSYREHIERGRKCRVGRNEQPKEKQAAAEEEKSKAKYKAIQKYSTEPGKKV